MRIFATIALLAVFLIPLDTMGQTCDPTVVDLAAFDDLFLNQNTEAPPTDMGCTTVTVPAGGFQSIQATISHTWAGDLSIRAYPPATCAGMGGPADYIDLLMRPGLAPTPQDNTACCGNNFVLDNVTMNFVCDGSGVDAELLGDGSGTADPGAGATIDLNPNPDTDGLGALTCADLVGCEAGGDWTICVGDGAGGDTGTLLEACVSLPVEMASFNGIIENNTANLTWTTLSEFNNAGFTVEHSAAGQIWEDLGFVEGNGTTLEEQHYSFEVANLDLGTHRFRLRQMDFDGSTSFSSIVNASNDLAEGFRLKDIYPNPFNPAATMEIYLAEEQQLNVDLYNVAGELVKSLSSGNRSAQVWHKINITAENLPSGQYFVRAHGRDFSQTEAIVLLK